MTFFVLMAFCSSALAYSYSFTLSKDNNPVAATAPYKTTSSPYVKQSAKVTPTTYFLQYREEGIVDVLYDPISTVIVSNYSTTEKRTFTYKTGYGASGQYMYMVGRATESNYNPYTTSGTWSP